MSSVEWTAYFGQKSHLDIANKPDAVVRANSVYGKCYDARTDAAAAALTRSEKGPSRAARADFAEFDAAVKDFAAKALADTQQSRDSQKQSYAALYERQFRYEFYQSYAPSSRAGSNAPKPQSSRPGGTTNAQKSAEAGERNGSGDHSGAASSGSDEMTVAKNRFGELLGALPDDQLHELHAAFEEAVGLHALDDTMRLAVYRYAIFLLEPSTAESSYPPPF